MPIPLAYTPSGSGAATDRSRARAHPPGSSCIAAVCRSRWARMRPSPARRAAVATIALTPSAVSPRCGALTRTNSARPIAVTGRPRRPRHRTRELRRGGADRAHTRRRERPLGAVRGESSGREENTRQKSSELELARSCARSDPSISCALRGAIPTPVARRSAGIEGVQDAVERRIRCPHGRDVRDRYLLKRDRSA
jgi:hypothetical protein